MTLGSINRIQVGAAIAQCIIRLIQEGDLYLIWMPQIFTGETDAIDIDVFFKFDRAEVVFQISQDDAIQAVDAMMSGKSRKIGIESRILANLVALES